MYKLVNKALFALGLAALAIGNHATALAQGQSQFELVYMTNQRDNEFDFTEIGPPQAADGAIYFKAYTVAPSDRAMFGIYRLNADNTIEEAFNANQEIPGQNDTFRYITAFDVKDGRIVFAGGGARDDSKGIFIVDGETITPVITALTNIPRRTLGFDVINDVLFFEDGILFTGGRETKEGLFYVKDGEVEILAHRPIVFWNGKRGFTHKWVRAISNMHRLGDEVIIGTRIFVNDAMRSQIYTVTPDGLETTFPDETRQAALAEIEEINILSGQADEPFFTGIGKNKIGGLYQMKPSGISIIADNSVSLWPADFTHFDSTAPKTMKPGDILSPSKEMAFKKYAYGFPFWKTVFSVYELEGLPTGNYIRNVFIAEEIRPIKPLKSTTHLWGDIGAAVGAGIAAALFGGPFIAPAANQESKFAHLQEQALLNAMEVNEISWENYFQADLVSGNGGFSAVGETLVFHAANLHGRQGLFLYQGGKYLPVIQKGDTLFGREVVNVYIGYDGLQGRDVLFWAELAGTGMGEFEQVLVRTSIDSLSTLTPN